MWNTIAEDMLWHNLKWALCIYFLCNYLGSVHLTRIRQAVVCVLCMNLKYRSQRVALGYFLLECLSVAVAETIAATETIAVSTA